jgi:hypothetical protein
VHLAIAHFGGHTGGEGTGDDLQVGAIQVRREVGLGRAETLAVLVCDLVGTNAFLLDAVEVGVVASPACSPASMKEVRNGFGLCRSITLSGPPSP